MQASINHPLETLVISNLTELINAEKSLKEHYSQCTQNAGSDPTQRTLLTNELVALSSKADRLHRMILAMDELMSVDGQPESVAVI